MKTKTLQTKSVEKSTSSLNNLIYKENFWDFYRANQKAFESLLSASVLHASARYKAYIPTYITLDEIKSAVMQILEEKENLKGFDPSKSKLNTYLTGLCRFYTLRVMKKEIHKSYMDRQFLVQGLNSEADRWNDHSRETVPEELHSNDDLIESLGDKDICERIRRKLRPDTKKIMDLFLAGLSRKDIAESFGVSNTLIGKRIHQEIREAAETVLKECTIPA